MHWKTGVGAAFAAATLGTCVALGSAQSAGAPEPFDGTDAQITAVTKRAIDDYNAGDLHDLITISCGQLRTDLAAADPENFAAEARSALAKRGRGSVTAVRAIKVHESVASADVSVAYDRNGEFRASGVYQMNGDAWQICGLS
ncbi:hypothetical protein [Nocardia arthritidis]|uniref:DUF4878 domain-containing protein n=1 Tax=Nocardia arthritidis TaxID=228602 RepID=A0A6G9YFB0_9NOCA|nr:hypothetical protein [Nocardia arthritidis]QIS11864.1 hypothetical protein F5544_19980 [Nocardia arthritidis]